MGKSKSIEELEAADQKFENYLDQKRKDIEAKKAITRKEMDADINKFYNDGGWDDRQPVAFAEYYDVQNISEWSLGNVNKILTSISGAIFGSNNPPAGTDLVSSITDNAVISAIPSLQILVLSRAFAAVQGILETFTLKSSTSITMQKKIEVVSPGVTIFVYINSNSYKNSSFFNNEVITQYYYMIDAFSSAKQLGAYTTMEDLRLFEKEKEVLRKIARTILDRLGLVEDLDKVNQLSLQLDGIYDRLEQVTERINELLKDERQAAINEVSKKRSMLLKPNLN